MANVFLVTPTHDGRIGVETAKAIASLAARKHIVYSKQCTSSMLDANCNSLWCDALNMREEVGLTWFAMLHSDVRVGADFLSVAIPVKDQQGVTSTAILSGVGYGCFCRLTLKQVNHTNFPVTFDIDAAADALERLPDGLRVENVPRRFLLANTGCMVCRLDRPWAGCNPATVWFEGTNQIQFGGGKWQPLNFPEDWAFTLRIAQAGGKVMATKAVRVGHRGPMVFSSAGSWGVDRNVNK